MKRLGRVVSPLRTELVLTGLGILLIAATLLAQQSFLAEPARIAGTTQVSVPRNYTSIVAAPLDDTYIHLVYARNLANGNGFSFTPGEPLSADTSPLFVILLTPFAWFSADLLWAAIGLSALFYILLAPGVYRVSRDIFRCSEQYALLAGGLTLLFGRLVWSAVSGMEITLATFLLLLIVEEHERCRQWGIVRIRQGLYIGLALLTRPEFALFAIVIFADLLLSRDHNWRTFLKPAGLALLLVLPFVLFNLLTSGSLASHSSKVQGARFSLIPDFYYLFRFALGIFVSSNGLLVLVLGAGFFLLFRDRTFVVLLIFLIGLPIAFAFFAPQYRHHGRYLFPLFPMFIIASTRSLEMLAGKWRLPSQAVVFLVVVVVAWSGVDLVRWIAMSAYDARNINDQQLAAASWAAGRFSSRDTIAADDVGALRYYSSATIVDLTGLTSPEIYPFRNSSEVLWRAARKRGATRFIMYDSLNRGFTARYKDSLAELTSFRLRLPLRSAADSILKAYVVKRL